MERIKKQKVVFKVGASFFVLAFLMIFLKNAYFFSVYVLAVLIHEFCHEFVARKLGYKTEKIFLSAFGAVLYGEFEGVEINDEIKIALAGPLSNLFLSVLTLAAWWIYPPCYTLTQPFFEANLGVFLINMLPCYPLDGGRVVFSLLNKKTNEKTAEKVFKGIGLVLSLLFFAVFVYSVFNRINVTFALFAIFLFLSSQDMSHKNMVQKAVGVNLKTKKLLKGMEVKTVAFSENCKVSALLKAKNAHYLTNVEVVDDKLRAVAFFDYDKIDDILLTFPLSTRLKDLPFD